MLFCNRDENSVREIQLFIEYNGNKNKNLSIKLSYFKNRCVRMNELNNYRLTLKISGNDFFPFNLGKQISLTKSNTTTII